MKNKIIKTALVAFAFIFTIASLTITLAWYTNINKIGSIDAEASDVTISYTINDDTKINEKSYRVDNLSFFDLTNNNELKYFNSMVNPIKLHITNHDKTEKSLSITFQAAKSIKMDGDIKASVAYPASIISALSDLDISSSTSVGDLIPAEAINNDSSYELTIESSIPANSSIDIYVHLFGVQEIKSSDNSFLFNPDGSVVEYEFKLIIEAANKGKNEAAIES